MKRSVRVLTVVLLSLAAASASASPVQLHFSLDPDQTLPIVPVNFRVRAINTGTVPASLPIRVRLEARSDGAEWKTLCFANWENTGCATELPLSLQGTWPSSIELAPGEERVLDYLAGPDTPPWFDHGDLMLPGSHSLRFVTWSEDPALEPITSNEVVLTIQAPSGADAGAWQLIRGSTQVRLEKGRFAEQLWSLYPDSIYTAMTPRRVPSRGDWPGYLAAFLEALEKDAPAGFENSFKYEVAVAQFHLMDAAMDELNVQKAYQHEEAARALLEELLNGETEATLKAEAARLAERNVMTLPEIEEVVERLRMDRPATTCEREQVKRVRSTLADLLSTVTAKAKRILTDVLADLDRFEAEAGSPTPNMHSALGALEQAASRLETGGKNQVVGAAEGTKARRDLAAAAELVATKAIAASGAEILVKQSDLDLARRKLDEGRAAFTSGDFKKAISRFREALHKAEGASAGRGAFC